MRRARGKVTLTAERPDVVVPHGTIIRSSGGALVGVVWPWWRRALCWFGFWRFAPRSGKDGRITVNVKEIG